MFFVSASAGGVSTAHFGAWLRLLRLFFRMPMHSEPGRPELKARKFHTPVENAIYLLGTSAAPRLDPLGILWESGRYSLAVGDDITARVPLVGPLAGCVHVIVLLPF